MNDHPIARWHKPQQGKLLTIGYLAAAFKVMLRPLKAINLVHERMAAILQARPAQQRGLMLHSNRRPVIP
jgi:hypothetical protein